MHATQKKERKREKEREREKERQGKNSGWYSLKLRRKLFYSIDVMFFIPFRSVKERRNDVRRNDVEKREQQKNRKRRTHIFTVRS